MTPLKKHRGHPGWLALVVLLTTVGVVWLDARRRPRVDAVETTYSIAPTLPAATASLPAATMPPAVTVSAEPVAAERIVNATGFLTLAGAKTHRVVAPRTGLLVKTRTSWLGKAVRPGEVLGYVYSSDVYATTVELLDALAKVKPQPEIDSLRYRLMGWGMPMQTISQIERSRTPSQTLPVAARVAGRVVSEPVRWWPVARADDSDLFTITTPGYYTVYVELPEADAARTAVGMPAQLTIDRVARPINTKVAYVWRRAEAGKRTVRFDVYLPRARLADNTPVSARFDFGR